MSQNETEYLRFLYHAEFYARETLAEMYGELQLALTGIAANTSSDPASYADGVLQKAKAVVARRAPGAPKNPFTPPDGEIWCLAHNHYIPADQKFCPPRETWTA